MRSKLYRRVRKLKVVHSEDLQQKQTLEKKLHDTTKETSTLKKEKVSLQKKNHELDKKVQKLKLEADIVTNLKMTNISLKLQDTDVQILRVKN